MKKVALIFKSMLFVSIFGMFTTTASAQPTLILQQGEWQISTIPASCSCNHEVLDCVCGIWCYNTYTSTNLMHLTIGQTYVVAVSQAILGTTLQINFSKWNLKLKSNDFTQKNEVKVDDTIAHSLGYEAVTILPGKYTVTGGNSLRLKVKLGAKRKENTSNKSQQ